MIGQTLNSRYSVTAHIGKGAMGSVYRATDSQTNQDVAIKIISRELSFNPEMIECFRREGEALRQLRHPNIVSYVDAFQHEEQYVIVMEYVGGGSLHSLIKQGPLPIDRARQIALDLCDALTRAHRLNIIHRDIKPENILLADDGTPRLTDFGIAKLMGEATRLTGTGTQVGTPYYMSPEAWESKPLDVQADIWSLGVVLYEMLTGEVPFGGGTLLAVMNNVLTASLPDPKTKRADVPDWLSQVVRRMLTRDKKKRYSTTRQIAADLELASSAKAGKRISETFASRRKEQKPKRKERPQKIWGWTRILRIVPIMLGALAVMGMIAAVAWLLNDLSVAQTVSQRTATAAILTNQHIAEVANRPTETSGPTPTIDIVAAATIQYALTQTFAPFAVQTEMQVNLINTATQSSLQTIVALTPTNTPTMTRTPLPTPIPIPTRTPTPVKTFVLLDFPSGCNPNPVPAGVIVFGFGAGGIGKNPEEAKQRVGINTYGTITLNGKIVPPPSVAFYGGTTLNERGRTVDPVCDAQQCGYIIYAETELRSGSYDVHGTWSRADGINESRSCTLIVK